VEEQTAFSQDVRLVEEVFQILPLAVGKQLQTAVKTQTPYCKGLDDLKRLQSEMWSKLCTFQTLDMEVTPK
jgi:hypothetical protein